MQGLRPYRTTTYNNATLLQYIVMYCFWAIYYNKDITDYMSDSLTIRFLEYREVKKPQGFKFEVFLYV